MSTLFFSTTAGYRSRHAYAIRCLIDEISTADSGHQLALINGAHDEPIEILRALIQFGPTISIFHFDGCATHYAQLLAACPAVGIISLPTYLAALPQPKLIFLNDCAEPALVDELTAAGIEVVIGTTANLPRNQLVAFTTTFYQNFLFADCTAAQAYDYALNAAQIQPPGSAPPVTFAGYRKLRRAWLFGNVPTPNNQTPHLIEKAAAHGSRHRRGHLAESLRHNVSEVWQSAKPTARTYAATIGGLPTLAYPSRFSRRNGLFLISLLTIVFAVWLFFPATGDDSNKDEQAQFATSTPNNLPASMVVQLQTSPDVLSATGEGQGIYSLAFSHDGNYLFATSTDNTVYRWALPTGTLLPTIQVETSSAHHLTLDPEGRLLAYAGLDGAVGFVSLAYSLRREFQRHAGAISTLHISHNGQMLFTSSMDGALIRHDLTSGESLTLHSDPNNPISAIVTNAGDKLLAFAGANRTIEIWQWAAWEPLYQLVGHQGRINWLDFSPTDDSLLSAGSDNIICLWDIANERELHRFTDFTGTVNVVRYFPNGDLIVAAGDDGMIRLWDAHSYQKVDEVEGFPGGVAVLAINHDGSQIATAGKDGALKLWDVVPQQEERE